MNLFWTSYLFFYSLMMVMQIVIFFASDSQESLYYHYMISLDARFIFFYMVNAAIIILNLLSLIPIYLYMFRIKFLSRSFWQGFLLIRLFLEIPGRTFEISVIKSLYIQDVNFAYLTALVFFLLHCPSYVAIYRHIFGNYNSD